MDDDRAERIRSNPSKDKSSLRKSNPDLLSRRSFLTLAGIGAAAVVGKELVGAMGEIGRVDLPIEFDFTSHDITDPLMEIVTKRNCIILGESSSDQVQRSRIDHGPVDTTEINHLQYIWERLKNGPYGSPQADIDQSNRNLDRIGKLKRVIVATDEQFDYTVDRRALDRAVDYGRKSKLADLGIMGLKWIVPIVMKGIREAKREYGSRDKWGGKIVDRAFELTLADMALTAASMVSTAIPGDSQIKDIIEILGTKKSEVVDNKLFSEEVRLAAETVEIRNASMVLNTAIVESTIKQNPQLGLEISGMAEDDGAKGKKLSLLFFAGSGHLEVRQAYRSGIKNCTKVVEDGVFDMTKYCLKKMAAATDEEKKDMLEVWTELMGCYSYPIPGYADFKSYQESAEVSVNRSPRLIAYETLEKIVKSQPDNPNLKLMVERLVREDKGEQRVEGDVVYVPMRKGLVDSMRLRAEKFGYSREFDVCGNKFGVFEGVPYLIVKND